MNQTVALIISITLPFIIPMAISLWMIYSIVKSIKHDKLKEKITSSDEFKEKQELEFLVKNHKIISLSYVEFNSFIRLEIANAIDAYIKFYSPQEITAEVLVNIGQYCIKEILVLFTDRELKAIDSLYYKDYISVYVKKICDAMIRSGDMQKAISMNFTRNNDQGEK